MTKYVLIASVGIAAFMISGCTTMSAGNVETDTTAQLAPVEQSDKVVETTAVKNKMPKLNIVNIKQDGDDVTCKIILEPGSRLRGKKYCFSKKTWEERSDESSRIVNEFKEMFVNLGSVHG